MVINYLVSFTYGWYQDELYFSHLSHEIAWGYVDIGPLVPFLYRISNGIDFELGHRIWCLVSCSALAAISFAFSRLMKFRNLQSLCIATYISLIPFIARSSVVFTVNTFEAAWWMLALFIFFRILLTHNNNYLLILPIVIALGILNKPTILVLAVGMFVALCRPLINGRLSKLKFLAGLLIFGIILTPTVIWQMNRGWPFLVFLSQRQYAYSTSLSFWEMLLGIVSYAGLFNVLLVLVGLWCLASSDSMKYENRSMVFVFAFTLLVLLVMGSKPYYFVAISPPFVIVGIRYVSERFKFYRVMPVLFVFSLMVWPVATLSVPHNVYLALLSNRSGIVSELSYHLPMIEFMANDMNLENQNKFMSEFSRQYFEDTEALGRKIPILSKNYYTTAILNHHAKEHGLPRTYSGNLNYFYEPPPSEETLFYAIEYRWEELAMRCDSVIRLQSSGRYLCAKGKIEPKIWWDGFKSFQAE